MLPRGENRQWRATPPLLALAFFAAGTALAEAPRFAPVPDALPAPHVYEGGWEHFVGGGLAAFDCTGDGLPELFAAGGAAPAALFLNRSSEGAIRFDAAPPPGGEPILGATGAYPLDLDGDGLLDLFVLRVGENLVLRGEGDCRFTRANAALGIEGGAAWSTAFTAWWGAAERPTLAVGNYVNRDDPEGPFGTCDDNRLHRPDERGGWRPEPLSPGYCALSMLAYTPASGHPGLRISNDRHYYVRDGAEQLWDIASERFLGAEDGFPRVSLWGMGIAARDITGDGRAEVMLTSMGDQLLQIARPDGSYAAAPFELGTYAHRPHTGEDGRPSTGWHAEWGDVNNDGRPDLFIAKGNVDQMPENAMEDPNNLLLQRPDGTFEEIAGEAGVASTARARGAALADLDGDGLLDLAVVNRRAPLEIWRNTGPAGTWLALAPRLPSGNRFAVGARVALRAGGALQVQEVTVGGGHAGGSALPLHFGLGAAERAEVQVTWPDGTASGWQPVQPGARYAARPGPDGGLALSPLP